MQTRPRRTPRWPVALLAAAALTLPTAPAHAAAAPEPGSTVDVAGVDVPVHGTFSLRAAGNASRDLVRGAVHGVRRVEGGTAVYLSLGLPASASRSLPLSSIFTRSRDYESSALAAVTLVDRPGMTAYVPLRGGDAAPYSSDVSEFRALKPGELVVLWAVFPELPAGTRTVDVLVGDARAAVTGVPVEDGALEPVVDDLVPQAGEGWPKIAEGDALAGAEAPWSVRPLVQHRGSVDEVTDVAETAEEVDATLAADVLFDKSSATLTAASQDAIARLAADIAARGTGEVRVVGHTDSDGSDSSNQTLSEQRAAAVVAALQPASGTAVTFVAEGRGESEPVAPNTSPENMQLNRRVTVSYQVQEATR